MSPTRPGATWTADGPPPDGPETWGTDLPAATAARPTPGEAAPEPDRFTLGPLLGAGGMGEVRVAHDRRLRRDIAIKTLRADLPAARDRFIAEAQVTAQLAHPNIVPVHDLMLGPNGQPALAMMQVRGRSLRELLRTPDALPLEARLDLFRKVCDAVAFAHDQGVIHRDIQCDNIMVGAFGEVLLMDWGRARPIGQPGGRAGRAGLRRPPAPLTAVRRPPAPPRPRRASAPPRPGSPSRSTSAGCCG